MTFKDRLRETIEFRGFSTKEISSAIGISNSTFLSYIDSRSVVPNVETAVKIAQFLNVTVEFLVTGETKMSQDFKIIEKISLNDESESRLIQNYESLSDHDKSVLLTISDAMSKMK